MKKVLLLVLAVPFVLQTTIVAQRVGYPTIFSEHRDYALSWADGENLDSLITNNWTLYYHTEDGRHGKMEYSAMLADSVVDGNTYMKVVVERGDTLLYRQDGDRVYALLGGRESLILDYGLVEGDVFEMPWGERYVVIEALSHASHTEYYGVLRNCLAQYLGEDSARILRLRSLEDDSREDEWMEGIGSVEWGIIPIQVLQGMSGVLEGELNRFRLISGTSFRMYANFETTEVGYAMIPFKPTYPAPALADRSYAFSGDTLCITDALQLHNSWCFAICTMQDNVVDIRIIDTLSDATEKPTMRGFSLRIPGFPPGKYNIYLDDKLCREDLVCGAEDVSYRPFIEEGKVCYVGSYPYGDCREVPFGMTTYYFGGDTIVAGRSCQKWMKGGRLLAPVYEEERQVYFFPQGEETPRVMYDFSVAEGEETEVCLFGSDRAVKCHIDSIRVGRNGFRTFYLYDEIGQSEIRELLDESEFDGDVSQEEIECYFRKAYTYTWTEGFGVWDMPEYNVGVGGTIGETNCLIRVTIGDEVVYDIPGAQWLADGVHSIDKSQFLAEPSGQAQRKADHALYDLTGRRIGQPRRGVYIQGGKKVVVR